MFVIEYQFAGQPVQERVVYTYDYALAFVIAIMRYGADWSYLR